MTIDNELEFVGLGPASGKSKLDALPQPAQDIFADIESNFLRAESIARADGEALQEARKDREDLTRDLRIIEYELSNLDPEIRNRKDIQATHARKRKAKERDIERANALVSKLEAAQKNAITAKHAILKPEDIIKALAAHPAQYFDMGDEFEEALKLPKGKSWQDWIDELCARPVEIRKKIKKLRGRPKTLREARQHATPILRRYLENRSMAEIRNVFRQDFNTRDDNDTRDTRGMPAPLDVNDGLLLSLLKGTILDSFDRELNRLAEKFGDRVIDAEARTAELKRLNEAMLENERLYCRVVRAGQAAGVKVAFRSGLIDPLNALGIIPAAKQPARPVAPSMSYNELPAGPQYTIIHA